MEQNSLRPKKWRLNNCKSMLITENEKDEEIEFVRGCEQEKQGERLHQSTP
jgi:hypothetical protein